MRFRLWLLSVILLLVLPEIAYCKIEENNYGSAFKQILLLSRLRNVRTIPPGRSNDGRAIPAYVISDYTVSPENKIRIMICSGQHGNEFNPVKSVIQLSKKLGSGEYRDLLAQCLIVIVPMVNPDGIAALRRTNAGDMDTNRDWAALSTVETRYVDNLVSKWKPQVIIDVHEWTESAPSPEDRIEVAWTASPERREALAGLAYSAQLASGLRKFQCSNHSDPNLLHRRYSSIGYASYLMETKQFESYEDKDSAYQSAIMAIIKRVCAKPEMIPLISPASSGFNLQDVAAYLKKTPNKDGYFRGWTAIYSILVSVFCLLVFVSKAGEQKKNTRWSRKYVSCELPGEIKVDVPISGCTLKPLVHKSWINRRTRSRYIRDSKLASLIKNSERAGEDKYFHYVDLTGTPLQDNTPEKTSLRDIRLMNRNCM